MTPEDDKASPSRGEPAVNLPGVIMVLIGVTVLVHVLRTVVLSPEWSALLTAVAAFVPIRYTEGVFTSETLDAVAGVTSPVNYALLHGSFGHLAVNMAWLAVFGAPLALRIGTARFLAFFAATAAAGAAAHYFSDPASAAPLVGASGAISGMTAAAARFGFNVRDDGRGRGFSGAPLSLGAALANRSSQTFIALWLVINAISALPALSPESGAQIAWAAHLGGFAAGFLLLGLFDRRA